uniref:Uncharacterized protein n=1 Tax=Glossina pallidipes TaxID=7398 RepID=A0A1A9ZIW5_GLOPL
MSKVLNCTRIRTSTKAILSQMFLSTSFMANKMLIKYLATKHSENIFKPHLPKNDRQAEGAAATTIDVENEVGISVYFIRVQADVRSCNRIDLDATLTPTCLLLVFIIVIVAWLDSIEFHGRVELDSMPAIIYADLWLNCRRKGLKVNE